MKRTRRQNETEIEEEEKEIECKRVRNEQGKEDGRGDREAKGR